MPVRVVPSPVTDGATVSFQLHHGGPVSCVVYDAAGNRVASLADGFRAAGDYRLKWNAAAATPGIYFCTLESAGETRTARLTKVR